MTCAKRQVTALLTTRHGDTVRGTNECFNPQPVCPRKPGEDYTKCRTICKQRGHAEIQAIDAALEYGLDLFGATCTVTGHYYVCHHCAQALSDAGVSEIRIVVEP